MKGYAILVEEESAGAAECEPKECDVLTGEASGETGTGSLIFVDAEDAGERYAIPKAFAAYARYMDIRLGNERFVQ